jgi:hypothetical protein
MVKLKSFSIKGTEKVIPKISKILSKIPVKPAKILNPFSSRSFSFLNLTLLDFFNKTPTKFLSN